MSDRRNPTRGTASESRFSVMEFMREFPDDDACLRHLWRARYSPDGEHAVCPRCTVERTFRHYQNGDKRQSWTCTHCGWHVHPTAGTIFHKSSTSLHLWFYALFLITSTRCGISAKQLERELGVTYKTAWRMFNVIRNSLMADQGTMLSGAVEMDETYPTPKRRLSDPPGQQGRSLRERVVIGAVERGVGDLGGKVVALHVDSASKLNVGQLAATHVVPSSMVYTDEAHIYEHFGTIFRTHQRVKHSASVYVDGDVHTQSLEGFWSTVKNGIRGVYRSVSGKWLQSYLDEYVSHYNNQEHTRRKKGSRRRQTGEAKFRLLVDRACRPLPPTSP